MAKKKDKRTLQPTPHSLKSEQRNWVFYLKRGSILWVGGKKVGSNYVNFLVHFYPQHSLAFLHVVISIDILLLSLNQSVKMYRWTLALSDEPENLQS